MVTHDSSTDCFRPPLGLLDRLYFPVHNLQFHGLFLLRFTTESTRVYRRSIQKKKTKRPLYKPATFIRRGKQNENKKQSHHDLSGKLSPSCRFCFATGLLPDSIYRCHESRLDNDGGTELSPSSTPGRSAGRATHGQLDPGRSSGSFMKVSEAPETGPITISGLSSSTF